jgi:hypothetical protein
MLTAIGSTACLVLAASRGECHSHHGMNAALRNPQIIKTVVSGIQENHRRLPKTTRFARARSSQWTDTIETGSTADSSLRPSSYATTITYAKRYEDFVHLAPLDMISQVLAWRPA